MRKVTITKLKDLFRKNNIACWDNGDSLRIQHRGFNIVLLDDNLNKTISDFSNNLDKATDILYTQECCDIDGYGYFAGYVTDRNFAGAYKIECILQDNKADLILSNKKLYNRYKELIK